MKKKQLIVAVVLLAIVAVVVFLGRDRIHFDFADFARQLAQADWRLIALGIGCIYLGYIFRGLRWSLLVRHNQSVGPFALVGTQVIGFTAVALIGRVADLVRPYLVSKKTGLPVTGQVAVYIVERLFDAGSMALIISTAIVLAPPGALPHPEAVKKAGYSFLAMTIAGALFLVAIRIAGNQVARLLGQIFGKISAKLGHAVEHKIHVFQTGLDTIRSFSDFAITLTLSVLMWVLITASYLLTMRAFTATPELATMSAYKCVLLMTASGAASALQLPILGWFSQIGIVATAIAKFYGVAPEPATACAATLLLVTFLSIVPVGLIWAQFTKVSLTGIAAESGHAGDELDAE